MSRSPATFKQRDVTRAIKAHVKAGIPIDRIRTAFDKQGRFVVSVAKPDKPSDDNHASDLDRELEEFEKRINGQA
jgi:hypothetical protein